MPSLKFISHNAMRERLNDDFLCDSDVGCLSGPSRLQRLLQSELHTTVFQLSVHGAASAEPSADVAARWESASYCAHQIQRLWVLLT